MKGKRGFKKILAGALAAVIAITSVPGISTLAEEIAGNDIQTVDSKIDVWDLGAEQLDETIYNNKLNADIINSWYEGVEAGTTGKNLASFQVTDEDGKVLFAFDDGSYHTTHRLRSSNKNITRFDEKEMFLGDTIFTGFIYSNKSKTDAVNVQIYLNKGDIMKAYVGSNGGASTITVEAPSGAKEDTEYAYASANSRTQAGEVVFTASEAGLHKIYTMTEKLLLARITVEHTQPVAVSGSVEFPAELTNAFSLVFTNKTTGEETVAPVKNGSYTAVLNEQFDYEVALKDADGFIVLTGDELSIAKGDGKAEHAVTHNVEVAAVELVTVTGQIVGMTEDSLKKAEFSFAAENIFVPQMKIEGTSYSMKVEKGVTYAVTLSNADDYTLVETSFMAEENCEKDIVVEAKPLRKITIDPVGCSLEDLAEAEFTFTRHSDSDVTKEENYVYTFTGVNDIALRDGTYTVKVTKSGDYKQKLTSNLKVVGEDTTKTIKFESTVQNTEPVTWSFTSEAYTGQTSYDGLEIVNGNKHGAQYGMMIKNGSISIPVAGACKIQLGVGYTWDVTFPDGSNILQTSDGGTSTVSFDYVGEAGTVVVSFGTGATSYVSSLTVTPVTGASFETDADGNIVITVGETGCNFTTINEALAAVRAMSREAGQRAIISIMPGNYEEMLLVDAENVTLKNASATPSTALSNKGVDIDENAVRITWYYGHGYTYYSMDKNCKFNAEVLEVNQENGYASFVNPGSGTTNGSYWNATVCVSASGFEADGIIFENSFNQYVSAASVEDTIVAQSGAKEGAVARASMKTVGDTTVQNKKYVERAAALALYNNVEKASFNNCKIIGRQDTLYGGTNTTAAFYDCDIYGGTDYIFGGMTAVFAKCNLVANTMEDNNDTFYITAAQQKSGRGYLMYNCNVVSTTPGVDTASEEVSKAGYLGRPWQANTSEVVFYATNIGESSTEGTSLINPVGWLSTLSGESDNVYEFGSNEIVPDLDNTEARVAWAKTYASYEDAKLADGTPVSVEAFLGDWDAFAGKDMTIEITPKRAPIKHEGVIGVDTEGTIEKDATLDAKDLKAFAQGAKADGDVEKAGTDNYFSIIYSAKSKVDSSSKTFEDGYTSSQRINLGGAVSTEKNAISFTTTTPNAEVTVWWVEGGDDNRQMAILDKAGNQVAITDVTVAKNATAISKFTLAEAGTYYLGGATNNNYIFKVNVHEAVTYVWKETTDSFVANDITAFAAGKRADGDEEKYGNFTAIYSAKSKVDGSSKTFEDGFAGTQRINFGGAVSTTKNALKFTTDGAATVKVWWVEGGDDNRQMAILDETGATVAITNVTAAKNATVISSLEVKEAGTYYLGGATNNNYIFKVEVIQKALVVEGAKEEARPVWTSVAAPVITNVEQNGSDMEVTVEMLIGKAGADFITVEMYDEEGNLVKSKKSSKEGTEVTLALTPASSGMYKFVVNASREDEETVLTSAEKTAQFVLPLTAPAVNSVTNKGEGSVEVAWDAVKEASYYIITVDGVETVTTEATSAMVKGLIVGQEYEIGVKAARSDVDKTNVGKTMKVTAKASAERTWGFVTYGSSTDSANNGFSGSANDDKVTVYSQGGKGKLVPNSTDGLSFYYTVVDPETENFTLEADVTVDSWTFSNGQEGFGLMVSDTIGTNGDANACWNNSIMNMVSKVEYFYDENGVTTNDQAAKITMKLGIGSLARLGVTAEDVASFKATGSFGGASIPANFTTKTTTLETSCGPKGAGTYNIIGNVSNASTVNTVEELTTFHMSIRRNNTGYLVTYKDANGNVIGQNLIYDTERNALTQIDADKIYVGFFASRNAKITATNIVFTTVNPADDEQAEERETEYIEPSYKVESSTSANSEAYDLVYYGNADGTLTVTDANNNLVYTASDVKANTKVHVPTTLTLGENAFTLTFAPNEDYVPGAYKKLSSYEPVTFTHTVNYVKFDSKNIYVAPNATSSGKGTKADPVDVYTAVKYAAAGQKIVLAGGTYNLTSTVKVERGHNGTKDAMIYMIADPSATERPVFNFAGKCAGMIFAGDYWYFQGFDCTNSANGQKGIQVSGKNNTLDAIRAYRNGNTGIQISRYLTSDKNEDWPANNLILNCTSFLNADAGYEDADGFAAKLTIGEGNVFEGCVAAYNADDGWDLFAKAETGSIGRVEIRNCIAFKNGYVLDANGNEINAGNGNGFKMGGESLSGYHTLKNSIAFANKAKGIDSNSCPDIQVYNCISYDNESYNVAFYTNNAVNTDFFAQGIISFKTSNSVAEQFKLKGTQVESKVKNETNYFVNGANDSTNSLGEKVSADWFVNLDKDAVLSAAIEAMLAGTFGLSTDATTGLTRNADGTLNTNGFLALTENAPKALAEEDAAFAGLYATGTKVASATVTVEEEDPQPVDPVDPVDPEQPDEPEKTPIEKVVDAIVETVKEVVETVTEVVQTVVETAKDIIKKIFGKRRK